MKKWGLRIGILGLALGGTAVALAGGPLHPWATGDVLQASDLNENFANLQGQITFRRPQRTGPVRARFLTSGKLSVVTT